MPPKIKNVNKLRDRNGKQILRYPKNTLLDDIIADLWGEIEKYLSCSPFMFGISGDVYPGYREMTKGEFNKILPKFVSEYKNQKITISKSIKGSYYYLGLNNDYLILHRGHAFYDKFPTLEKGYCLRANRLSLYGPYCLSNVAIIMIFDPFCL
jgi:hypothetical protein